MSSFPFTPNAPQHMELLEEMESMAESSLQQSRRTRSQYSLALGLVGWLIIGSALNAMIFASFPLKLATAEWQLNLIGTLLSQSFNLLIGASLVVLARLLNSKDKTLRGWQRMVSRLASWLVVIHILAIPTQYYLGARVLKNQAISAAEGIDTLKNFSKGISATNSEPEFRTYVASVSNAPVLPAKFDAAFPVIKQRAIQNITAQINAATTKFETQKAEGIQAFLKEAIRNTAQAILMAAAFSALANLSGTSANPVKN